MSKRNKFNAYGGKRTGSLWVSMPSQRRTKLGLQDFEVWANKGAWLGLGIKHDLIGVDW
jgi:hypothetical protein